jgi:hypothetical protein
LQLNPCGHNPYVSSSLTRTCYWKLFLVHYKQVLCQFRFLKADHGYFTYHVLQRQLSHLNGRKLDHRQVLFYMSGFALPYTTNMFILIILYGFCLLPAQLCYIIVHIRKVESRVQIADGRELCFVGAAILRGRCLPLIPRRGKPKSLLIWSVLYGGLVECWRLNAHFWIGSRF